MTTKAEIATENSSRPSGRRPWQGTTPARWLAKETAVATVLVSLVLGPAAARAQVPAPAPAPETVPAPPPDPAVPPTETYPPLPPPNPGLAPLPGPVEATLPSPLPPPRTSKLPSFILWGAAAASLIVGGAFAIAASSAKSDFDDDPTYDKADKVHDRAVKADVGLGLGIILAVTGTIFFLTDSRGDAGTATADHNGKTSKPGAVAHVNFAPLISPNAGGGVVSMRF
jgi:hypothetical protein